MPNASHALRHTTVAYGCGVPFSFPAKAGIYGGHGHRLSPVQKFLQLSDWVDCHSVERLSTSEGPVNPTEASFTSQKKASGSFEAGDDAADQIATVERRKIDPVTFRYRF
jgi:hypothetical protein